MKKFNTRKTCILEQKKFLNFERTDMPYLFKTWLINSNLNLPFFFG